MMESLLERHLAETERHIEIEQSLIEKEKGLLERLAQNGHETTHANGALSQILHSLESLKRHRTELRRRIG
jgi:hypothetical protein